MTSNIEKPAAPASMHWQSSGAVTEIEETLQQLSRLRARVDKLGCKIKPGSRIAIFEQHFARFLKPGYHPRRDPDFDPTILAHGCRDLFELNFICEQLADSCRPDLLTVLPELLSGAPVPNADRNQNPRNLQFQYVLAAQLAHSGFTITLEEPDAMFVHENTKLGIAAKRPVSSRQLTRRVREGIKQLQKTQSIGFIAVSLDRLLKVSDPYLVAGGEAALDAAARENIRNSLSPYAPSIKQDIADTNITGIIFSLTLVGCVRVPWQPAHTTARIWLARKDGLPYENELIRGVVTALRGPTEI